MRGDTSSKGSSSVTSESLGAPSRSLLNIFRIDDLPGFLLVEILCRLPCKFVLRCKCVCKSWSTLISHPYFDSRRALYLRNIGDDDNEQILMFVKYSYGAAHPTPEFFTTSKETKTHPVLKSLEFHPSSLNIHLADQSNQVFVLATHNDLILLCDSAWNYQRNYYICNPYTKQWVALPPAPRRQTVVHVGLTNCDSYSRCRVVRIVDIFEAEPAALYLKVEIFSSETGEWIETVVACPQGFREVDYRRTSIEALAYKGTLYWLTLDGSLLGLELDYSNHKHRCRLISKPGPDHVDLNSQEYKPDCLQGVCQGYLRLCRMYPGPSCTLYVWELKEDDEAGGCKMMKWCLKERVVLDKLASELERCRPLAFDPNDEDILYLWRLHRYPADSHAPIVMCNIRTMTVTDISQKLPCLFRIDAFPFVLPRWRWPTPVPS